MTRFLLEVEFSVASTFLDEAATCVGARGGTEVAARGGGSGIGLVAGAGGVVGGVVAVVARTGLGGKFNLGSFSKGAEVAPSSALVAGGLVFIWLQN